VLEDTKKPAESISGKHSSKKEPKARSSNDSGDSKKEPKARSSNDLGDVSKKKNKISDELRSLLEDPLKVKGQRVAKYFDSALFCGTVDDYAHHPRGRYPHLWHITYDDNDREHLDEKELLDVLALYKNHRMVDPFFDRGRASA